jgi:phenylalanyl-tRNA synthetase beta chain
MKVLLSWLREFAPIEGDPLELADVLSELGLAVEDVQFLGRDWAGIVVARVLALRPHPQADRIQLVDVDTGGGEALQICCGAFNMAEGDLVPLATLGTTMPDGMRIERRKLRGEWSNGMLCSARELGLGEDHGGIHVLAGDPAVGAPLAEALGVGVEVLYDLDVTGNRPDALSVMGVARDLAARLRVPFTIPEPHAPGRAPGVETLASVRIAEPALCPRFGVRVLRNLTLGPSPTWLAERLVACGMRPINVVVDISNYVMLELGHPNHTYDLDRLPDGALAVRMAAAGEELETLDGQLRRLTAADGLIVDATDRPVGLAGVMGGASTEIGDETRNVLLEAAVWDRMTVARTSRRHGLRSEASTRFERGVDPEGVGRALDRFCQLAVELAGAEVAEGSLVVDGALAPTPPVRVRTSRVNHLLGTDLDRDTIASLLDPIGFTSEAVGDDELMVSVPSFRPDSAIEEDVIEEVARHHGYERVAKRVPAPSQTGGLTALQQRRRRLRRALVGAGLTEAMPLPFLAPGDLTAAGLDPSAVTVTNPLVAEESVLRTSLLPGLVKAVAYNQSHRNPPAQLFEIGHTYRPSDAELPDERERLAVAMSGADAPAAVRLLWRLVAELGVAGVTVRTAEVAGLHPTRSATIQLAGAVDDRLGVAGGVVGAVGEVDPGVLEAFGVQGRVAWLEVEVGPLLDVAGSAVVYQAVSRFPSSDLDLAFVVPDEVPADELADTLAATDDLVRTVSLFDVFRGPAIGDGRRSLAYRIRLQADDRTLTDAEAATVRQRLIDVVVAAHGAELR